MMQVSKAGGARTHLSKSGGRKFNTRRAVRSAAVGLAAVTAIRMFGFSGTHTANAAITWGGETNSTWDTSTTNFYNGSTPTVFSNGSAVIFGDLQYASGPAVTNYNISIASGGVSPSVTTFNNSAVAYTITSSDAIGLAGTGTVAVTNGGSVTLAGSNTFTGPISITSGSLRIAGSLDGGSYAGVITNNGLFTYSGSGTQVFTTAMTGTGAVNFSGGTATLNAINTYIGGTTVTSGVLNLNAGGGSGAVRGILNISSGATVNLTAVNALGYTVGSNVSLVNVNGGVLNDSQTAANNNVDEGYATNFNLTGGTLSNTGGTTDGFNLNVNYSINTLASSTTSVISAPLDLRGANIALNVAQGTTVSGIDLNMTGNIYGTGPLVKGGAGTLQLSGVTAATQITLNAGKTIIQGSYNTGTNTSLVRIGGTAILDIPSTATVSAGALEDLDTVAGSAQIFIAGNVTNTNASMVANGGLWTQTSGTVLANKALVEGNQYYGATYYLGGSSSSMTVSRGSYGSLIDGGIVASNFYVSNGASLTVTGDSLATIQAGANGVNYEDEFQLSVGSAYTNGNAGTSFFIQQGGSVNTNGVVLGSLNNLQLSSSTNNGVTNGTYYLNGGTLTTGSLAAVRTTGTFIFGGGTLVSSSAFTTSANGTYNLSGTTPTNATLVTQINSGGANINTSGGNITWTTPISAGTTGNIVAPVASSITGGSGYTSPPAITITGGGGTGGTASAIINQSGQVTDIIVTNPGSGYTSAPTFAFGTANGGTGAVAVPTIATGNGGLTITGGKTFTLTNASTYLGTTTVNSGSTLFVTNTTGSATGSGPVQINGGSTLTGSGIISGTVTLADGTTSATQGNLIAPIGISPLTLGGLSFGQANTSNLSFAVGSSPELNIGTLTAGTGTGLISFTNLSSLSGNTSYPLATFNSSSSTAGGATVSTGSGTSVDGFSISNIPAFGTSGNQLVVTSGPGSADTLSLQTGTIISAPASAYFKGNLGSTWNANNGTSGNFTTDAAGTIPAQSFPGPTTNVYFVASGATNLSSTLGQSFDINSLTFLQTDASSNTIGAISIGQLANGSSLQIEGGGITNSNVNGVTLSPTNLIVNTSQQWTSSAGSGALTVNSAINGTSTSGNTTTLSVADNGSNPININGVISDGIAGGNVGITVNGSGTGAVILAGLNTYTGPTNVNSGTLQLGNGLSGSITSTSAINVATGGNLALNEATTSLVAIAISNNGTVTGVEGTGITNSITGLVSGTGGVNQSGPGVTILANGANSYTGNIVVSAGTLSSGTGGTSNTGSGNTPFGNTGVAGRTITINYGGTINLTANNIFGDAAQNIANFPTFVINGGTLTDARYNDLGNITLTGGTINNSDTTTDGTYNDIALEGTVTVNGSSPSFIANTVTGATFDYIGLGYPGGTSNVIFNVGITSGTGADLTVSGPAGFASERGNAGGFTKTGAGTMLISAPGTYTGGTNVENGILVVANATALGTGAVTLGDATSIGSNLSPILQINGAYQLSAPIIVGASNASTSGVFTIGGTSTSTAIFAGTITLNQNLNVTQTLGGTTNITGAINGSGGLIINTVGTVAVGAGNYGNGAIVPFTGGTTVNQGTLNLITGGTLGSLPGVITINPAGVVNLTVADALGYNATSGTTVTLVNINGGLLNNTSGGNEGFISNFNLTGGTINSSGGAFNFSTNYGVSSLASSTTSAVNAPISLRGTSFPVNVGLGNTSSGIDLNLAGVISGGAGGTGPVVKSGAGTLLLSGSNSFTGGATIENGTLIPATGAALGAGPVILGDATSISSNLNPVLQLNSASGISNTITVGANTSSTTGIFTIRGASTGTSTLFGPITLNQNLIVSQPTGGTINLAGGISGSTQTVTLSGGGAFGLSGESNFSGGTSIIASTASAATAGAFGTGTVTLTGSTLQLAQPVVAAGSTLSTANLTVLNRNDTVGNAPTNTGGTITLTDNNNSEARSAFSATPVNLSDAGGFNASFIYAPGGSLAADGVTFVIENDPRGSAAVGSTGSYLGYGGSGANGSQPISNSGAVELNIYTAAAGGIGTNFSTNGSIGTNTSVSPVQLAFGNPIQVNLNYSGGILTETLTDTINGFSSTTTYPLVGFQGLLGGTSGYVGFTGATGGQTSSQNISNFSFVSGASPSTQTYANNVAVTSNSTINVTGALTATMGNLAIGSTLNVSSSDTSGSPYSLSFGQTTLTANSIFNVSSSSGGGAGNLLLGSVSSTGTNSVTLTGNGTVTMTGSNTYTGGTFVNSGKLILASANAFPSSTSLNVSAGALVQVAASVNNASYVPTLSALNNSGVIDLTNNAMVIQNSSGSIATLFNEVKAGYNNGAWNGTGSGVILSSVAAADTKHLTAVGIVTGFTSFEGAGGSVAVGTGDVVLKYTYYGDTNLDGKVDGSDYSRIDNGALQGLTGWQNGDFNYDGVVNGSDYTLIDNAYNTQGPQINAEIASATAQIAGGSSAVPEPASLGLIGIGAAGLLGRRRRRHR